jgi:putative hemolysin
VASTLFNGLLAIWELAIVSLATGYHGGVRQPRGARVPLELIEDPSRFLSTVQIGITLVGIIVGRKN